MVHWCKMSKDTEIAPQQSTDLGKKGGRLKGEVTGGGGDEGRSVDAP